MEPPYIDSIEWSKWHVLWVDERVVPKDHVDSNYKLAYDGFLSKVFFFVFTFYYRFININLFCFTAFVCWLEKKNCNI